jgi:hypothetical protein
MRRILCYARETWTISEKVEMTLEVFERKILSSTYGPIQETVECRIRYSKGIYGLYNDTDEGKHTELRRLGIRWRHPQHGWMKNTKGHVG